MKHFFRSSGLVCLMGMTLFSTSLAWGAADQRFDIATIDNTPDGSDPHFTLNQLNHLNFITTNGHFLMVSTDTNRPTIKANGNFCAGYYNDLQSLFQAGYNGYQAGDQIRNWLVANFSSNGTPPQWVVLNEISRGAWDNNTVGPAGVAYHNWVSGVCERLTTQYNQAVILFSPYTLPATSTNGADWQFLSQYCHIGVEGYLSGAAVNGSGNSVSFCQNKYQSFVDSYHAVGVPYNKIYMTEHYAQTVSGTAFGRSGVSYAGWDNAIKTRATAIHNIFTAGHIGGYLSYGWAGDAMGVSETDMCHFEDTYASKVLP